MSLSEEELAFKERLMRFGDYKVDWQFVFDHFDPEDVHFTKSDRSILRSYPSDLDIVLGRSCIRLDVLTGTGSDNCRAYEMTGVETFVRWLLHGNTDDYQLLQTRFIELGRTKLVERHQELVAATIEDATRDERIELDRLERAEKKGTIYVIRVAHPIYGFVYKVGYTTNLPGRISGYRTHQPDPVHVEQEYFVRQARKVETMLHRQFITKALEPHKTKREWFVLDESDLDLIRDLIEPYLVLEDAI